VSYLAQVPHSQTRTGLGLGEYLGVRHLEEEMEFNKQEVLLFTVATRNIVEHVHQNYSSAHVNKYWFRSHLSVSFLEAGVYALVDLHVSEPVVVK